MIAPSKRLIFQKVCSIIIFLILGIIIIKLNYNIVHSYVFPSRIIRALVLQILIFMQILLLLYLFSVKIFKKELKRVGIVFNNNSWSLFFKGAAIAGLGALIAWFVTLNNHGISYLICLEKLSLAKVALWACGSLFQVSYEELLFRTWVLAAIAELVGDLKAIGIGGLLFGLAHLLNPALSLLGIFNGVLVGIIFCLAFIASRSVWMSIGLHFGWNFCQEILASPLLGKTTGGVLPNLESTVAATISILLIGILVWYNVGKIFKFSNMRIILIAIVLLTVPLSVQGASARCGFHLTILHSNDFHGHKPASLARQATWIKAIRAQEPNVLVLNGGDVFTRGKYQYRFYGALEFAALNAMGTDVLTLGNNEFKATSGLAAQKYLFARINQAEFSVLCANVLLKKTGSYLPKVQPYTVINVNGVKVGILGLSTKEIRQYGQAKGFVVLDPIKTAVNIYPKVATRSDLVIALTHIGYRQDRILAKAVPGLAAIVGAHSHTVLKTPVKVGNIPIAQAGNHGKYLGRLDLYFENAGRGWALKRFKGQLLPIDKSIKEDPEVKALIDSYVDSPPKAA
jgi:membrane protease YdiL (CAAX protease family)/predicted MPP superfamily phosphohydrolase